MRFMGNIVFVAIVCTVLMQFECCSAVQIQDEVFSCPQSLKRSDGTCCESTICEKGEMFYLCMDKNKIGKDICKKCPEGTGNDEARNTSFIYDNFGNSITLNMRCIAMKCDCPPNAKLVECSYTIPKCECKRPDWYGPDPMTCIKSSDDQKEQQRQKGYEITQTGNIERCKDGFFKPKADDSLCISHTKCKMGEEILKAGTSIQDVECGIKPTKAYTRNHSVRTNTPSPIKQDGDINWSLIGSLIGGVVGAVVGVLVILVIVCCICKKNEKHKNNHSHSNPEEGIKMLEISEDSSLNRSNHTSSVNVETETLEKHTGSDSYTVSSAHGGVQGSSPSFQPDSSHNSSPTQTSVIPPSNQWSSSSSDDFSNEQSFGNSEKRVESGEQVLCHPTDHGADAPRYINGKSFPPMHQDLVSQLQETSQCSSNTLHVPNKTDSLRSFKDIDPPDPLSFSLLDEKDENDDVIDCTNEKLLH